MNLLAFLILVARLLNIGAGFLDSESKRKLGVELSEAKNLKADLAAIASANAARAAVPTGDASLRAPDPNSRT